MSEFVLGTGLQESARKIIELVEHQLVRTEGIPRQVTAKAPECEIVAEREDYEGPFTRFNLRLQLPPKKMAEFDAAAEAAKAHCAVSRDGNWTLITCPVEEGAAADDAALDALDALTKTVKLPEVWRVEGGGYRIDRISTELLFQAMIQYKASDVHLSPGSQPIFRIDSQTRTSDLMGDLSARQIRALVHEIADDKHWEEFERDLQTSFNFHQIGLGYSRVSAFTKSGATHCTFRYLPEVIPSFDDLHIPNDTMTQLADLHRGLLLVTGMTGSGKTTTVAALIDWINTHKHLHILTIENPIEYVHEDKKSIISQRSLGSDVESFDMAVTGALRHDPDVILIGEMRDSDTIRSAINAAATGHLVISTLHANTASEVVNRVVSFFDPVERDLVKLQLRDCLQCVICQRLVPRKGGGRLPALEILLNDVKSITDGIIAGDTDMIRIGMQQTVSHSFLFEHYLHKLYKDGEIDLEQGQEYSTDESIFNQMTMGTYSVPRLEGVKHTH